MTDPLISFPAAPHASAPMQARQDEAMRKAAVALEASFLSEMLRQAGLGESSGAFSGGIGEEQFASFLRDEQAKLMAQAGGIGLAETIFQAMNRGQ